MYSVNIIDKLLAIVDETDLKETDWMNEWPNTYKKANLRPRTYESYAAKNPQLLV